MQGMVPDDVLSITQESDEETQRGRVSPIRTSSSAMKMPPAFRLPTK